MSNAKLDYSAAAPTEGTKKLLEEVEAKLLIMSDGDVVASRVYKILRAILGGSVYAYPETFSPEDSCEILKSMNSRNRKRSLGAEQRFARDMENGIFYGSSLVSFGSDSILIDGQSRMGASAGSDNSFDALVGIDVPLEAVIYVDTNRNRTFQNGAEIVSKQPKDSILYKDVSLFGGRKDGVVKSAFSPNGQMRPSPSDMWKALEKHADDINFVYDALDFKVNRRRNVRGSIINVPCAGAILRAVLAGENREEIGEFCSLLTGGESVHKSDDSETYQTWPEKVRDRMIELKAGAGAKIQRNRWLAAAHGLKRFLSKSSLSSSFSWDFVLPMDDYFPIDTSILVSIAK